MKLGLDKYSEKLKPLKDFFVKYNKTIYFVFIAIIVGFLLVRVSSILSKQTPFVDISEEATVKGVNTIKHAKYDVYNDALNYCSKESTSCVNTQIERLLTNIAMHDNTLSLKEAANSQSTFKDVANQVKDIQSDLGVIIATGVYSDTIATINNAVKDKGISSTPSPITKSTYNAIMGNTEAVEPDYFSNKALNDMVSKNAQIQKESIKPTQEKITAEIKQFSPLRSSLLKEQKASINDNSKSGYNYLIKDPNLPALILPTDLLDGGRPSGLSLYGILISKQSRGLTNLESELLKLITNIRSDVIALNKATADFNNNYDSLILSASTQAFNLDKFLPTKAIATAKNLKIDNAQEQKVLDKLIKLDKTLDVIKAPYTDNNNLITEYNKKISTYVTNNSDEPTALKLLNPTLTDGNVYNPNSNPFVSK